VQADRLNRIIGVLALLYVAYIAIALLWGRLRDARRNSRRRDMGPMGLRIPLKPTRQANPFRKAR
jgi:hypothetical protein